MKTKDAWLEEYADSHRNPTNQWIHRICVPVIMVATLGMLCVLRLPGSDSPLYSLGAAIWLLAMGFYATLGLKPFLLMMLQGALSFALLAWFEGKSAHPGIWYTVAFVLAWIGQAIGHWFEGKRPSFFKDLQFLLIGPLWVMKSKK